MKSLRVSGLLLAAAKPNYLDPDLPQPTHLLGVPRYNAKGILLTPVPLMVSTLSPTICYPHSSQGHPYSPGHSKPLNRIRFQVFTEVAPAHLSSLSSCHLWLHTLSPIQPRVIPIIQRCRAFSPLHNSAGAVPNTQSTLLCLHLTNVYTSSGPQLNSHLLQEALSDFQARLKASSVSPLLQCQSLHTVYLLAFPISGCGFNEGKDYICFSPCYPQHLSQHWPLCNYQAILNVRMMNSPHPMRRSSDCGKGQLSNDAGAVSMCTLPPPPLLPT